MWHRSLTHGKALGRLALHFGSLEALSKGMGWALPPHPATTGYEVYIYIYVYTHKYKRTLARESP